MIPVPNGLRRHAQVRCHLFCRPQTCLPQAGPPVLQAVCAAELGDMGGLEGQPREGAIPLGVQCDGDLGIRRGVSQLIDAREGLGRSEPRLREWGR